MKPRRRGPTISFSIHASNPGFMSLMACPPAGLPMTAAMAFVQSEARSRESFRSHHRLATRSLSIEFSSQTEFLQHVTQLDLQRVEISQRIAAVAIIAFPEICFQVFLPVRVAR